jgi:hypothetical protein
MGVSEHGALLHGGVSGAAREHVVLATKPAGEGWHERIYAAGELAEVLPYYAGRSDVYISTQRFWGWRRIARLAACGALAVDVDFYKVPKLAGAHPLGVLEDCRSRMSGRAQP